jgi:hypothetical protein
MKNNTKGMLPAGTGGGKHTLEQRRSRKKTLGINNHFYKNIFQRGSKKCIS